MGKSHPYKTIGYTRSDRIEFIFSIYYLLYKCGWNLEKSEIIENLVDYVRHGEGSLELNLEKCVEFGSIRAKQLMWKNYTKHKEIIRKAIGRRNYHH